LAINLDIRRLAQTFVEIAKVILHTVAEMHVADLQRYPCRAVFPDESRKVFHVHNTRVETKLLQSRDGGSIGKNAPGRDTVHQLETDLQAAKHRHVQGFGNLLTEAQTAAKMFAFVFLQLQLLMISYISSKGFSYGTR
jgi:hypothetical protein